MHILSQTIIRHRKVFLQRKPVTGKCFCNRNQSEKKVSVILEKSIPSFVANQTKKFVHFQGTFNKNRHEKMEDFVESCLGTLCHTSL